MERSFTDDVRLAGTRRVDIGTTYPAPPDVGLVYIGQSSRYDTGRTQFQAAHFTPAKAREIAQTLLDAADIAESDLLQQTIQSTEQ